MSCERAKAQAAITSAWTDNKEGCFSCTRVFVLHYSFRLHISQAAEVTQETGEKLREEGIGMTVTVTLPQTAE
jgi:hypothetical protein